MWLLYQKYSLNNKQISISDFVINMMKNKETLTTFNAKSKVTIQDQAVSKIRLELDKMLGNNYDPPWYNTWNTRIFLYPVSEDYKKKYDKTVQNKFDTELTFKLLELSVSALEAYYSGSSGYELIIDTINDQAPTSVGGISDLPELLGITEKQLKKITAANDMLHYVENSEYKYFVGSNGKYLNTDIEKRQEKILNYEFSSNTSYLENEEYRMYQLLYLEKVKIINENTTETYTYLREKEKRRKNMYK